MAKRRRLDPAAMLDAPAPVPPRSTPIAEVARAQSREAALEAVSQELESARAEGRMVLQIPLERIDTGILTRDRMVVEDGPLAELEASIAAHGQRTPIEVAPGDREGEYILISGWRRLQVMRNLHATVGGEEFATIRALVRTPADMAEAYVSMVEENEIRVDLSYYERARIAALSVSRGVFETEKEALLQLFASASRAKRSRIRAFLEIYHALGDALAYPTHLPERLGLRLVDMIREDGHARLLEALEAADPQSPEEEQVVLTRVLSPPPVRQAPEAGKYDLDLGPDLRITQTRKGRNLVVKLSGAAVDDAMQDQLLALFRGLEVNRKG